MKTVDILYDGYDLKNSCDMQYLKKEIESLEKRYYELYDNNKILDCFYLVEYMVDILDKNIEPKSNCVKPNLLQPETLDEIFARMPKEFYNEIYELFKNKYLYHATGHVDFNLFFNKGLLVRSEDIFWTTFPIGGRINDIIDELFNKTHRGNTSIVILDANQNDLQHIRKSHYDCNIVPKETIKCVIDTKNCKIYYNPHYIERNVNGVNNKLDKPYTPKKYKEDDDELISYLPSDANTYLHNVSDIFDNVRGLWRTLLGMQIYQDVPEPISQSSYEKMKKNLSRIRLRLRTAKKNGQFTKDNQLVL